MAPQEMSIAHNRTHEFASVIDRIMLISGKDISDARLQHMEKVSQLPSEDESVRRFMRQASYETGVELP